ncbi:hypothetical protein [uncultured Pseudoteredinibacter sp.]|uniref:hypothetical protein n=1 Tax=uncultured Pseudoteredinibacter sp. TaxID=1641701 RepID=UPI002623624D|nr:hypothetical protein [uncultured Pseudoteredinibacter sp.]
MTELPNFEKLPSILSYDEVARVLSNIMDVIESGATISINEVEELLNEGLFALEYNPKGRFDEALCNRITRWVELNWHRGDESFIDGAIALYVNFASNNAAREFFTRMLEQEERATVRDELRDALDNDLY